MGEALWPRLHCNVHAFAVISCYTLVTSTLPQTWLYSTVASALGCIRHQCPIRKASILLPSSHPVSNFLWLTDKLSPSTPLQTLISSITSLLIKVNVSISYCSGCCGEPLRPPFRTEELISSSASLLQIASIYESSLLRSCALPGAACTQCLVSMEV